MARVSQRDIDTVADGLLAAAIGDVPWAEALGGLNSLVPCEFATMEVIDHRTGHYADFQSSATVEANSDYLDYYFSLNPRLEGVFKRPELLVMRDQDFLSEAQIERNEFYNDFLKPHGLRYCAGVRTVHNGDRISAFSVQRSLRHGPVTDDDVEILSRIRPHMRRATLTYLQVGRLLAENRLQTELLSHVPDGVIVIGPSGKIRHMNARAEAICRRKDGLSCIDGALTIRSETATQTLARAIAEARQPAAKDPAAECRALVLRPAGLPPYLLTIVPIPGGRERRFDNDRGSVAVWVRDPALPGRAAPDVLREAYGLSQAEADIACALGRGLTVRQIAGLRDVSIATVRSQVQSILQKTHLHRHVDLARLLTKLGLTDR